MGGPGVQRAAGQTAVAAETWEQWAGRQNGEGLGTSARLNGVWPGRTPQGGQKDAGSKLHDEAVDRPRPLLLLWEDAPRRPPAPLPGAEAAQKMVQALTFSPCASRPQALLCSLPHSPPPHPRQPCCLPPSPTLDSFSFFLPTHWGGPPGLPPPRPGECWRLWFQLSREVEVVP